MSGSSGTVGLLYAMRYLALALALAACKHSPPADCGKKAAEVAAFLRTLDQGPVTIAFEGTSPPLRDDLTERGERAPQIEIAAGGMTYQGQLIGSRDELADRLSAAHDAISEGVRDGRYPGHQDPDLIAIVADEHVPLAQVAAAVDAAQASGFTSAMFVFRRTPTKPPPRTAVDEEIDKIVASGDPADKAAALAKLASEKIDACPALKKVFSEVSPDGDDKAKHIIDGIEPALNACGCAADPYMVRSLIGRVLYVSEPTSVLRVKLDPSAPAIHAATWGEASKRLTPATKAVWFN